MKNIHVLPTDKPSRLYLDSKNNLNITDIEMKSGCKQNIYITSDEFNQRTDWVIYKDVITKLEVGDNELFHLGKKIILTTDQSLDGVQAIDDAFLEWFVKNPSCEEVEWDKNYNRGNGKYYYKIIIPKEEPKQETLEEAAEKYAKQFDYAEDSSPQLDFIEGAKWQQERSYSEEEVLKLLRELNNEICEVESIKDWFEQFKKK